MVLDRDSVGVQTLDLVLYYLASLSGGWDRVRKTFWCLGTRNHRPRLSSLFTQQGISLNSLRHKIRRVGIIIFATL